jgi:hypothetical protein
MPVARLSGLRPAAEAEPALYVTGTSVIFFAIVNAVKLIPYFALGQFDSAQPHRVGRADADRAAGNARGAWIVRRMRPADLLIPSCIAMVLVIAAKLVYDGISGPMGLMTTALARA